MSDGLYTFTTGAFGAAFLIVGAGFLFEPGKSRVRRAFGSLFLALGSAYTLSRFSMSLTLPVAADTLLVLAIVFAMSQSLFEISLYLFGDEAVRGSRRRVYLIGASWSLFLWLLPGLDVLFRLQAIGSSVEDGRALGPFHSFAAAALYLWPLAIAVISFKAGRWHPADLPREPGAAWTFLGALAAVVLVLIIIGLSLAASWTDGYRAGHTALQLMMLSWFFYFQANPDAFKRARGEIERRHAQREALTAEEAEEIAGRLRKAAESESIHTVPDLTLGILAGKIGVPAYKLSAYFNGSLGMRFPEWLNAARIEQVRRSLLEKPERSILDLSLEAGYISKGVFNHQFRRLVGMSPREYRAKNLS